MLDNDEADNNANCRGTWPFSCEASDSREQLQGVRVSDVGPIDYLGTLAGTRCLQGGEAATQAEADRTSQPASLRETLQQAVFPGPSFGRSVCPASPS